MSSTTMKVRVRKETDMLQCDVPKCRSRVKDEYPIPEGWARLRTSLHGRDIFGNELHSDICARCLKKLFNYPERNE